MKVIAVTLFFVGFLVCINAKAVNPLPNGGSILSPSGKYIPGIILRIFYPIFENLKKQSELCSVGYVEIMLNLVADTDSALATNNAIEMRLLFKVFADLFQKQLPFVRNRKLYDVFVQCVEGNKVGEASLSNGRINWCEVNGFFVKASNTLNDSL